MGALSTVGRGSLIATITHVHALAYAAEMLGDDVELLQAIIWSGDNLTYGSIISVYTGLDETITALTEDGVDELSDMLREARRTTQTWHGLRDDFVDDQEFATRFKAQPPR